MESTPQPKRRNLFDEAPADDAEAFESPRATEDSLPPSDAFEAPGASDDDFGIPDEAPMDDGDEMPADDFGDDSGAPASDDSGFEPATEAPMDEAPAEEPMEEGVEGEPGLEGEPGIEGEPEPLEEEAAEEQGDAAGSEQGEDFSSLGEALKAVLTIVKQNPIGESDQSNFEAGYGTR